LTTVELSQVGLAVNAYKPFPSVDCLLCQIWKLWVKLWAWIRRAKIGPKVLDALSNNVIDLNSPLELGSADPQKKKKLYKQVMQACWLVMWLTLTICGP